jgi:hypothetical protein
MGIFRAMNEKRKMIATIAARGCYACGKHAYTRGRADLAVCLDHKIAFCWAHEKTRNFVPSIYCPICDKPGHVADPC